MTAVIRTERLSKRYGTHPALIDLDLQVEPGEVFGYLGPNGAGKTTTIRLLLDLIRPTSGRAEVLGMDVRSSSVAVHRKVGYLAGDIALYDGLTGHDHLTYLGNLRGGVDPDHIRSLADRFDLDLSRPIRELSKGNRQKVGLIQAFMHRPALAILDEPTSGLDPLMQLEFHRLLREVTGEGATVLLSSHVLSEVERIGDRVAILRAGRLVTVGSVSEIKVRARRRLEVQFGGPVPSDAFAGVPGLHNIEFRNGVARLDVEGSMDKIVKVLAQYEVTSMVSHEPDLEEIFMEYYRKDEDRAAEHLLQDPSR
jgi:ABC-2 type transport system ATP-binding protein